MSADKDNRLHNAYRCLRRNRYDEAIRLIEPLLTGGYDPYPLFLAGLAYLESDHFDRAIPVIRRLRSSFPDYLPGRELDLFVSIKSSAQSEDATVSCMNLSPVNRETGHFRRLEKRVRRSSDFSAFQKKLRVSDCVRIGKYHPRSSFAVARKPRREKPLRSGKSRLIPSVILLVTVAAAILLSLHFIKIINHSAKSDLAKSGGIDMLVLPDERYPLTGRVSRDERYAYPDGELLRKDFESARKLAKEERFNDALLLLNRIVNSNAQPGVVDRAEFLRDYVVNADNRNADPIPVSRIVKEPELYRGVMIRFRGTILEMKTGNQGAAVSVRLEDGSAGVAEVFVRGKADVRQGGMVKVEGVFLELIGAKRQPYIEARKIERE